MLKKLLTLILLVSALAVPVYTDGAPSGPSEKRVYICTGSSSECYHSTLSCKGLQSCKHEVKAVSLEKAQKMGRRPCKWCY